MNCPQSIRALLLPNLFLKNSQCLPKEKRKNKNNTQKTQQKTSKTRKVDNMTCENSMLFQYPVAAMQKDQLINCLLFLLQ